MRLFPQWRPPRARQRRSTFLCLEQFESRTLLSGGMTGFLAPPPDINTPALLGSISNILNANPLGVNNGNNDGGGGGSNGAGNNGGGTIVGGAGGSIIVSPSGGGSFTTIVSPSGGVTSTTIVAPSGGVSSTTIVSPSGDGTSTTIGSIGSILNPNPGGVNNGNNDGGGGGTNASGNNGGGTIVGGANGNNGGGPIVGGANGNNGGSTVVSPSGGGSSTIIGSIGGNLNPNPGGVNGGNNEGGGGGSNAGGTNGGGTIVGGANGNNGGGNIVGGANGNNGGTHNNGGHPVVKPTSITINVNGASIAIFLGPLGIGTAVGFNTVQFPINVQPSQTATHLNLNDQVFARINPNQGFDQQHRFADIIGGGGDDRPNPNPDGTDPGLGAGGGQQQQQTPPAETGGKEGGKKGEKATNVKDGGAILPQVSPIGFEFDGLLFDGLFGVPLDTAVPVNDAVFVVPATTGSNDKVPGKQTNSHENLAAASLALLGMAYLGGERRYGALPVVMGG